MRSRRPRLDGRAYREGAAYLLTFCTAGRARLFVSPESVESALSQILRAASRTAMAIAAYCFMPDHLHLLIEPVEGDADVRRFAALAKQLSGYDYRRRMGQALWQPSWHDRTLRRTDDRLAVIRYLLQNPVRAGLVQRLEEYPFLGSGLVTREALMASID